MVRQYHAELKSGNSANTYDDQKFTGHFLELRSARNLRQEGGLGIYHAVGSMSRPTTGGYDPESGRFWGVDAMRSEMPGWNTYHYTFNNPVKYVDPDGNMPAIPLVYGVIKAAKLGYAAYRASRVVSVAQGALAANAKPLAATTVAAAATGQLLLNEPNTQEATAIEVSMSPDGNVVIGNEVEISNPLDNTHTTTKDPSSASEDFVQNGSPTDPNNSKPTGNGGEGPKKGLKGVISRISVSTGSAGAILRQVLRDRHEDEKKKKESVPELDHNNDRENNE